jgi:hypothetical protein
MTDVKGSVWVYKRGELMLANKRNGTVREFGDIVKARKFVANLIWISKSLTPSDFRYWIG